MRGRITIKYILSTLWISSLYVVPLLIFARGLLLHRDALTDRSFCKNDSFSACFASEPDKPRNCLQYYNSSEDGQYCTPSEYKTILILIDALRFDFVEHQPDVGKQSAPYHNKLRSVTDLLSSRPEHTRLFRFIADPPTTTMQRVKGLTTGSLPTFIDVGSNFASAEIDEDNIVDIMTREGKNVVFLGDDTWTKLYPGRFVRSFPFDSFNVWDLDTVDRGIQEHLVSEIRKTDWHLIIAHFLGVDHCGHRYGPNHPEMERKLLEMDFVIRDIVNEIREREDITLFVIGDHGMTSTGDHGGETENEVTSAWFAYSPVTPFFGDIRRSSKSVSQVDIVPTLSSIIGVPVPFSNTGRVVLECVPSSILSSANKAAFILWQNMVQLTNYVNVYSRRNTEFGDVLNEEVFSTYVRMKKRWYSVESTNMLREIVNDYDAYMKGIFEMCRRAWIQFDPLFIAVGITFMFCALILGTMVANDSKIDVPVSVAHVYYSAAVLIISSLFLSLYSALILYQVFSTMCLFRDCSLSCSKLSMNLPHILVMLCNVCLAGALFSNSFILEEASVSLFLIVSCLWITYVHPGKSFFNSDFIMLNVVYRIGFFAVKCREEQPRCRNSLLEEKYNAKYPFLAAIAFVIAIKKWSDETGPSRSTFLAYVSKACMLSVVVFWINESTNGHLFVNYSVDSLPGLVFSICGVILCILVYDPILHARIIESQRRARIAWANISLILCILVAVLLNSSVSVSSVCMVLCLLHLGAFLTNSTTDEAVAWSPIVIWSMSSLYWFHATGHYASFSAIEWNAAFLFQKDIGRNTLVPGALVTMSTFVSYIVHGLLLFYVPTVQPSSLQDKSDKSVLYHKYLNRLKVVYLKYVATFAFRLLAMMIVCTIHSRHLMMWQIFAPRFIFEALAFLVTILSSLIGLIFANRIYP